MTHMKVNTPSSRLRESMHKGEQALVTGSGTEEALADLISTGRIILTELGSTDCPDGATDCHGFHTPGGYH